MGASGDGAPAPDAPMLWSYYTVLSGSDFCSFWMYRVIKAISQATSCIRKNKNHYQVLFL